MDEFTARRLQHQVATTRPRLPEAWARSGEAPLWVAICLYAAARAQGGMLNLDRGELRLALVPHLEPARGMNAISEGIRRGIQARWLGPGSTAYRLYLDRPPRA